jgi:hypothetical protein
VVTLSKRSQLRQAKAKKGVKKGVVKKGVSLNGPTTDYWWLREKRRFALADGMTRHPGRENPGARFSPGRPHFC